MTGEAFLEQHNISEQFALDYGVAWDENHLHIPIKDEEGKLLFLKSRNLNYGEEDNKDPKYKNPIGSQATLFNWHIAKNAPNIILAEGECLMPNAEVLTKKGWIKIKNYSEQEVLQYDNLGTASFVKPYAFINKKYEGNMVEFSNAQKFYSLTTPEHNLVVEHNNKLHKVKADLLNIDGKKKLPRTALQNGPGVKLTDEQIRLCVAVSADVTIRKEGDLYAGFKKSRKIKRFSALLDELLIPYSTSNDNKGYTTFFIKRGDAPKYLFKIFPHEWVGKTSLKQKKLIINELLFWDGNAVPNRDQIEYATKEHKNAVFVQTLAHLCGFVSTVIPRTNQWGSWYKVSILFNKTYTTANVVKHKKYVSYKGRVYCLQVPSGMLVVRQNDCISITGNCDALKLTEEGIPAISTSGGAGTFKDEWIEQIKDKGIYICYDNDEAGYKATRKLLNLFPTVRVIELPEEHKDICDFFYAGNTKKDFLELGSVGSAEWQQHHRKPEHNIVTARDIETKIFPAQKWLIENVVYSEGFCFIYGAEGTGKSYITLDMAKSIATGTPWLDKFPTTKAKVLFIDKENPQSLIQERLAGLGVTEEKIGDAVDNIYWIEKPEYYQLTNEKGEASEFALELGQIIIEENIDLIIVDSFVDLVVGNENSSADTQAFFSAIRELYPSVAYVVLHHENKPSQGVSRNSAQRLRGSSNINAQTFTMFRLEPIANSKTEMTLHQTKARNTQKLSKFMIRMKTKPTLNGGSVVSGFEYVGEISKDLDDSKTSEIKEAILQIISEKNFVSRQDALDMGTNIGGSEATIRRAIDGLLESGEIIKHKNGRKIVYVTYMFSDKTDYDAEI